MAYRRFTPSKCNIHFANDAFHFVEDQGPCVAMAFDVKEFFESLDHKELKQRWKQLLGVNELPGDHYAVFKAITRYAWVERDAVFALFGITNEQKEQRKRTICTPKEFRERVRTDVPSNGLIKPKEGSAGIPQGSPISALLSNIYMISVDIQMARLVRMSLGRYYRYSDDILIICPAGKEGELETALRELLEGVGLRLHDGQGKRTVSIFSRTAEGHLGCDRPLQYLGFTFDGCHVRVRSQTIARYLRRMRKAVRREIHLAKQCDKTSSETKIRRKRLYRIYSHLGTRNFIRYAKKARRVFDKNKISDQIKHYWRDLHALLVID
jgi:hypothetical protein